MLARYKTPALRASKIIIRPDVSPAVLFPVVLEYDISTRITVQLDAASINSDYFIEEISEHYDARDGYLETTWGVSDAAQYLYAPPARTDVLIPNLAGDLWQMTGIPDNDVSRVADDDDATYLYVPDLSTQTSIAHVSDLLTSPQSISNVRIRLKLGGHTGSDTIETALKCNGGTTYYNLGAVNGWQYIDYATNPNNGSAAWTESDINSIQAGARIYHVSGGLGILYEIKIEVTYVPAW